MSYDIYVNGEYETTLYLLSDVVDYVNDYGLTMIDENEQLSNGRIILYCEED